MSEPDQPKNDVPLADYSVVLSLPVQWGDQDAMGHVNNIVFFRWFESGRIQYMREVGVADHAQGGLGMILAATACDYRRPVTFPDTVHVGARVTRIGRSSMTMEYAVYSEAQAAIAAEGTSTIVAFDYQAGKPREVPEAVRGAIGQREGKPFPVPS